MWVLLSKPLEWLGRLRLHLGSIRSKLSVGDPNAPDARGQTDWRRFRRPETLFEVWGPDPGSPWEPFHTVPLFASLDRIRRQEVGPAPPPAPGAGAPHPGTAVLPDHAQPGRALPPWLTPNTWTIVDLTGPASVAAGAWLAEGAQLVCTFDNWPHTKGVLKPEHTLAALIRWASTVEEARRWRPPGAPPVWLCESLRLRGAPGRPGQFDNRYYLDDSILPGTNLLRAAGITRIVYLTAGEAPQLDLETPLAEYRKDGIGVFTASIADSDFALQPYEPPATPRPRPSAGFRRSSAGGFGTEVPEPSSGSSSG